MMIKSADPPLYVHANKSRLKQAARTGGRKLFDARRRAVFLEWFAATCNAKLAAEMADINYHTVFRHRRLDSSFAEAWDAALAQGYAVLEAGLLSDALAAESYSHSYSEAGEQATDIISPLSFEQRMALLREYRRADGRRGPRAVGKPPTIAPRIASAEEMEEVLIKRLKHFAMRVAEADAGGRPLVGEMASSPKSSIPITGSGKQHGK